MELLSTTPDTRAAEWDRHADYKGTFFPERKKELIGYWLSQRAVGNSHIDLGSGWYESVPGSVAVDISRKSLTSHPANEKYLVDLDKIGHGEFIPVADSRFETASMISVWQYISDPRSLLQECERILQIGGLLYINKYPPPKGVVLAKRPYKGPELGNGEKEREFCCN